MVRGGHNLNPVSHADYVAAIMILAEFAIRVREHVCNASDEEIFREWMFIRSQTKFSFAASAKHIKRRRGPSELELSLSQLRHPCNKFTLTKMDFDRRVKAAKKMPLYGYTTTRDK